MNHDPAPQMLVILKGKQWGIQHPDGYFIECVSAKLANEKALELENIERLYKLWMTRNVPLLTIHDVLEATKRSPDVTHAFMGHKQVHFDMCGAAGYIEQVDDAWEMTLLGYTVDMGKFTTENGLHTLLEKAPLAANRARHEALENRRIERGEGNLYLPLSWA